MCTPERCDSHCSPKAGHRDPTKHVEERKIDIKRTSADGAGGHIAGLDHRRDPSINELTRDGQMQADELCEHRVQRLVLWTAATPRP